jgi:catechol 2,3-dioxygenase-like lactoylglutathione lyase family enzyme
MGRRVRLADRRRGGERLMHVVLAVSDVDRAKGFYREVFGWEPHLEWEGEYAELVLSDVDRLGLYRREGWSESAGAEPAELNGRVSPSYLYVRVHDLDATLERLEQVGARRLSPRQARGWGDEAAYFADPDGNAFAVAVRSAQ